MLTPFFAIERRAAETGIRVLAGFVLPIELQIVRIEANNAIELCGEIATTPSAFLVRKIADDSEMTALSQRKGVCIFLTLILSPFSCYAYLIVVPIANF